MMAQAALRLLVLVADGGAHGDRRRVAPAAGIEPGYVPAPVPDPRFDVPGKRAKRGVALVPSVTDTQGFAPLGNGYTPGSTFDRAMTRRVQPDFAIGHQLAPGLTLRIPLK